MWWWFGGGGGCNFFLTFYAISNISRNKILEYKPIISHLMFSSCFFLYVGNIEKGRWFLQIVDIHVGNFSMKLTGRWFPQIVDRDSGNLYPIYTKQKLWC